MFNISPGTILDVAIGLAVMYLMFSLVGAALNELIASIIALRAKMLSGALESIIDDPQLHKDFFDSGVIAGVKDSIGRSPSYIASADFAHALVNSLDPSKPFPVIADIRQSALLMPDSNIRDVLLAQLAAAEGDMNNLRTGLAQWFDAAMDRLSGVYTRYMKYIGLVVGILIAIAFNADSLSVAARLWQDPTLRGEMVKRAGTIISEKDMQKLAAQPAPAPPGTPGPAAAAAPAEPAPAAPSPAAGAPAPAAPTGGDDDGKDFASKINKLKNQVDAADTTLQPLPIGWSKDMGGNWLVRILGWIVTGLAVSLGAPFWFDILSKFMSIRGAGDKPAKATDS